MRRLSKVEAIIYQTRVVAVSTENQNKTEDHVSQPNPQQMPEITATELKERLDRGDDVQIVDVREANEYAVARIPNSKHIPLGQVTSRMSEIDPDRDTVVHCKMGGRSAKAIEALRRAGFEGRLTNLKGGITAWSNEVDPSVPKY
jgi:rhodanese-related sulfurtransferase